MAEGWTSAENGRQRAVAEGVKNVMNVDEQRIVVQSEFANIAVGIDRSGLTPTFEITDLRSGVVARITPIELESLVWSDQAGREHLIKNAMATWSVA